MYAHNNCRTGKKYMIYLTAHVVSDMCEPSEVV